MKLQQIQNQFLLFTLSFICIIFESICKRPYDIDGEIRRKYDDLDRKKHEHSDKDGELQICHVIMNVLIGTIIFFLLIIISFALYEIINCYIKKKGELERKELYTKNIQKSINPKIFCSKLSNGSSSSSTDDEKKVEKVKNSFHSSNMSASIRPRVEYNNNSNNVEVQKSNINESDYYRPRENSGYEAPIIEEVIQKNNNDNDKIDNDNKEQKLLTNDGNEENVKNVNMKNPFKN